MYRIPLTLVALAGLAFPAIAQEVEPIDECAPETLFEALGIEENPECELIEEEPGDDTVGEGEEVGEEETSTKNPVSIAAKLPGNNREAAQAHASEMGGGNAGGNGNGNSSESGSGNGNGKGNGKS